MNLCIAGIADVIHYNQIMFLINSVFLLKGVSVNEGPSVMLSHPSNSLLFNPGFRWLLRQGVGPEMT